MEVWAVRLESSVHFTAYVMSGDGEVPERTWVCLRAAESLPPVPWLGCWSCSTGVDADQVRQLLDVITQSIGEPVRVGPYGPIMRSQVYFGSWETWGGGTPRPIVGFRPWERTAEEIDEIPAQAFDFSQGGLRIEV
ncbi:hypothetical protein SGLAM104S_06719 [Streptomyces glaucescens]